MRDAWKIGPSVGRLGVFAASIGGALLLMGAASSAAFASGGPVSPPPSTPTSPPPSNFVLTGFSASPVSGSSHTYNLTVTVTQTSPDGSDFGTPPNTSNKEFHAFPQTIYVDVINNSGTVESTAFAASLTTPGNPGITYLKGETGDQSATATYQVVLPSSLSLTSGQNLAIVSPDENGPLPGLTTLNRAQTQTFRMGPVDDNSWNDDIVSGTATMMIPTGQLPEVPYAAVLPAVAILGLGAFWLRNRTRLQ